MNLLQVSVILCAAVSAAFADTFTPGELHPIVPCAKNSLQTYSLYLPSSYTTTRKWPVIYCFDPSGRGTIPVQRLQSAAEKYGYILAGSLISRNGPWARNSESAEAIAVDISDRFSIDPQATYAVGMSGAARVATAIAQTGKVRGAIACGAGFPVPPDKIPPQVPFLFFGLIGSEDFNYAELIRIRNQLDNQNARFAIRVFDGKHVWPSAELLTEAVEWLELQAMREGRRDTNPGFVAEQFQRRSDAIPRETGAERYLGLKRLVADFDSLVDTRAQQIEVSELAKNKTVRKQLKAERDLLDQEDAWVNELASAALDTPIRKQLVAASVQKRAEAPEDSPERRMIRRAAANFTAIAYETTLTLFEQKDYQRAASYLEMTATLKPDHARTFYDLARAYAYLGDTKQALSALSQSVAVGFTDSSRAKNEAAFANISIDARFQALLAEMQTAPKDAATVLPLMQVSAALEHVELRPVYLRDPNEFTPALSYLVVEAVRANTPAQRAGIVPGTELIAIQGRPVRGLRQGELNALLSMRVKNELNLTARLPESSHEVEILVDLRALASTAAPAAEPGN